ncbi:hypothetical protein CW304_18770 [Bacillus sp. UFRGS-B20]|nr:hypothetical protein CW304_18770 [Bacillus sp. UFRGS-B20]
MREEYEKQRIGALAFLVRCSVLRMLVTKQPPRGNENHEGHKNHVKQENQQRHENHIPIRIRYKKSAGGLCKKI